MSRIRSGLVIAIVGLLGSAGAAWFSTSSRAADGPESGFSDFPKLSLERDWPFWRGPTRNGIAVGKGAYPTEFGDAKQVLWKAPVPGRGHSSPTVVATRVFLTSAEASPQRQFVLAFDRSTGKPLWQTEVSRGGFPAKNHPKNTEATPTPACDGERVYASFYHHDQVQATALDLDGKQVWQKRVGPFNPRSFPYGYAPSPLLYKGTVIFAGEYDGESWIVALDRKTGAQAWKTVRPTGITFSTPVVGHVAGRDQLLISGANLVASYDPDTGKSNWTAPGTTAATCGTMVWEKDIVVASGGYPKSETVAVKADGSGKILWKNPQKCYEQSMLAHNGYVYALTDGGILFCWRLADGEVMWRERLEGPVSASGVLAGGLIYWPNESGKWYVFRPDPKSFQMVAQNQLGNEAFASATPIDGQFFIRAASRTAGGRQEFLYCIGK